MRDAEVYQMKQRSDERVILLYKQINFLNTRMEAIEKLLNSRWAVIKAFLFPHWFKLALNAKHFALMQAHDMRVTEAAQKADEEARKPKITIVPALALFVCMILASSCVSTSRYKRDVAAAKAEGYNQADKECVVLQGKLGIYITQLQERLKIFNQTDSQGQLYPLKKDQLKK